jgi:heat shock protein HtpX
VTKFKDYHIKAADWRLQLQRNQARTRNVMILFVLIYVLIGLLIDVYLNLGGYHFAGSVMMRQYTPRQALRIILTGHAFPYATATMFFAAVISLWVTYQFHDRLVMLGTKYKKITEQSTDLAEQQLFNIVNEMKIAAGLHYMPRLFIIDANYMNAFASGFSEKSALIAVTQGLMEKLTRAEMQAVIAHELSHIRHQDIKLTLTASVLSNIMLICVDFLFYRLLVGHGRNARNGLVIIIILVRYFLPVLTILLMLYLSRTRELMADAGCVELMRDNEPLASALLKIHEDHLTYRQDYRRSYGETSHEEIRRAAYLYDPSIAGIKPDNSMNHWFSTHPSLEKRLAAIGYERKKS